jgi:hypothetical protein
MPRPQGSLNVEHNRFIVPNQFEGLPYLLRIWNTAAVALNLYQIKPDMAERYLEVNLKESDKSMFTFMCSKQQRLRHPLFGTRKGDNARSVHIGSWLNDWRKNDY